MKMTTNRTIRESIQVDLIDEAIRYHDLAKEHALRALMMPPNSTAFGQLPRPETLAREHAIRAETYRAAAALVLRKS